MKVCCSDTSGPVWRIALTPSRGDDVTLTLAGLRALEHLLVRAADSAVCRVIVLEAAAGGFCRGMDLQLVLTLTAAERREGSASFAACLQHLRGGPRFVVAAIDGAAIAGGLGLGAAADLAIATEASSFGLPELVLGLVPAMVLPLVMERVGPQRARRLALGVGSIDATAALGVGLIDELVGDRAALERAVRRAIKGALRLQPDAVASLKRFATEAAGELRAAAIARGRALTDERLERPEVLAAIRGFGDGEPAPWLERYRPERGGDHPAETKQS